MTKPEIVEPTCGATAANCKCSLPIDHSRDTAHHCTDSGPFGVCNGKWRGTYETYSFEIVQFPIAGRV